MSGSSTVHALERGLDILETLAASDEGVHLHALAKRLRVSPSAAHNLARTLLLRGYVKKSGRNRAVLYKMGAGISRLIDLRERRVVILEAERLFRRLIRPLTDATLLLAEPVGEDLIAALRMDTSPPAIIERYPNWNAPAYTTAISICYLAFWPVEETESYRRRYPFSEYGRVHWTTEARLASAIDFARRRGYARISMNDPFRVAAPVRAPSGQCIAALGLSLHGARNRDPAMRKRLEREAIEGAAGLSAAREASSAGREGV